MVDFEEIVNSEEEEASLAVSEDDAVDEDDLLAQFLESEVLAEDSEGYSEDLDQHWKHSRGLPDEFTADHACSGRMCTYSQIGDAFICEKTGRVHVCDDTCREIVLDPSNELLVCTISGRCFDRWLSPSEEELNPGEEQGDANTTVDEAEPFMGSGRFARAYLLGYNCDDEKELEAALACC